MNCRYNVFGLHCCVCVTDVCVTIAGRVCVPIDTTKLDSFDPFSVPTISRICQEFEAETHEQKPQKLGISLPQLTWEHLPSIHMYVYMCIGYMKTSLRPYMEFFRDKFLNPLLQDSGIRKRKGSVASC